MAATPENTLVIETTRGPVTVELRPDLAPIHVARIKELARQGFYDGVVFHRVIDGFMAQTGDPTGTGRGGSGQKLRAEFSKEPHTRGAVSMARAQSPELRRQPVFHLLRRCELPQRAVHRVGPCQRRHGECRQDHPRRASVESRQDRLHAGGSRRGLIRLVHSIHPLTLPSPSGMGPSLSPRGERGRSLWQRHTFSSPHRGEGFLPRSCEASRMAERVRGNRPDRNLPCALMISITRYRRS